jgi:hypothetical protein
MDTSPQGVTVSPVNHQNRPPPKRPFSSSPKASRGGPENLIARRENLGIHDVSIYREISFIPICILKKDSIDSIDRRWCH